MNVTSVKYRLGKSSGFQILTYVLAFACVIPLLFILIYIIQAGVTQINLPFLVNVPKPLGETGGGIPNTLFWRIFIIIVSSGFLIPLGILSGVYFIGNKNNRLS